MTRFQRGTISACGLLLALNAFFPPVTFESRPQFHERSIIFMLGEYENMKVGRDSQSGILSLDVSRWVLWSAAIIGLTMAVVCFPHYETTDRPLDEPKA